MPGVNESPCLGGITTHFADTYEPTGPFGAKGIGEAATNPVAAAYANALRDAIGIRFYELPITPEKILAALNERSATQADSAATGDAARGASMSQMTNTHIILHRFDYDEPDDGGRGDRAAL